MSKNQVFDGSALNRLSLHVGPGKNPGDPVKVGDLVGVCETHSDGDFGANDLINSNATDWATVTIRGSFRLKVNTAGATGSQNGKPVYINGSGVLSLTGTDKFGVILDDTVAVGADTLVHVAVGI